jgi:hypothetical protein
MLPKSTRRRLCSLALEKLGQGPYLSTSLIDIVGTGTKDGLVIDRSSYVDSCSGSGDIRYRNPKR